MGEFMLGSSAWNYPDTAEKGGWAGEFYADKHTETAILFSVLQYGRDGFHTRYR